MTANMYRVGDYVYFEATSTNPYQIRRIEELNKTPNGNVEAKVMCFFRRRDLPTSLVSLADKHQGALDIEGENSDREDLSSKQRHQLTHRELFLSRQVETLPATLIRGKCSVTLLNETESLLSYLNKDDTFFYCLVFDPSQRTLLADKGEIRVGPKYQAEILPKLKEGDIDPRKFELMESLMWTPEHNLTDKQIDQFLVTSRSVGTFARALDCSSSVKQPSLHMSAQAASRDITLFHAMDTLHKHGYNLSEAHSSLVPSTGPVLCRDEMEEWSAFEANLFEEALEKYGKDFTDIRQDFLPWKTLKNIIEYYYMWKTTDRYVQQKRVKAVEAESKLKQVYIPNYNKPAGTLNNNKGILNGTTEPCIGKPCESCGATASQQWYSWGPSHMQYKLCQGCWNYWKKYGGLRVPMAKIVPGENEIDLPKKKSGSLSDEAISPTILVLNMQTKTERIPSSLSHRPHRCSIIGCAREFKVKAQLARHYATAHGLAVRAGSPRPIMKTRTAFYLATTPLTRIARRLCRNLLMSRHAARSPFWTINVPAIKQECQASIAGKSMVELRSLLVYKRKDRGSVTNIATQLGLARNHELIVPDWLSPTPPDHIPRSERIAFPKPPKAPDGSLLYERIPNKPEIEKPGILPSTPISGTKRKHCEEVNGVDGSLGVHDGIQASKRLSRDVLSSGGGGGGPIGPRTVINHLNGKARVATMSRTGRKQVISWMDAPDDVYFKSTTITKKVRKQLTAVQLRRAARKPWRKLSLVKGMEDMIVVLE
ncbi:metastasis-associated protein [Nesidiocoris tenuis]|uniref:Metastasis-associated protein n=1 Tax=Nesidiocoris tenuis TaxID=355587 RepID=A0ABN7ADH0_9HEMI|nr:metastasis-associated protein [Nesidiocoris tenuis]